MASQAGGATAPAAQAHPREQGHRATNSRTQHNHNSLMVEPQLAQDGARQEGHAVRQGGPLKAR